MFLYKLKNVSKIYEINKNKTYALDGVNLKIKEGDFVVILGPSGSGKSTLLNILSGIDKCSVGDIYFNNNNLSLMSDKKLTQFRKDNVGFVFQNYNLIPNLTVKENIEIGSYLSKNPLDINEIIKTISMEEHKTKYPYQLSGGQMQRVAIARAISKNPSVLFCDEPTGALDEKMGKNILTLISEVNRKYKTTVILVTHNSAIAEMANMVIKMNSGHITQVTYNKNVKSADSLRWA